jgi:hypothetical protein
LDAVLAKNTLKIKCFETLKGVLDGKLS